MLDLDAHSRQSPLRFPQKQDLPFPPLQRSLTPAAVLDELLSQFRTSRDQDTAQRPSLYHDASRPPSRPLFSRKIDWLPSPNVLHYVPLSLSPQSDHLQLFSRWQSDPRVSAWWNQDWPEAKQRDFLTGVQKNDDTLGLVGYWSTSHDELGEPWGYVEIYWAKVSDLGFMPSLARTNSGDPIGSEPSLLIIRLLDLCPTQFAFALEARCELVVSEPDLRNQKMVDYECECGGVVEKPIDLPHKRAALVFFPKEVFGKVWPIGPRKAMSIE